ncbi:MAG: NAD-dependent epimerase/dehydratase family protein [Syntrophobacteraceae bacterium]
MEELLKTGCIVTGVAGFVGSHLAERLLAMGCRVVGVDNFFSGRRENMASFEQHPAFTFYELDIKEPGLLQRIKSDQPGVDRCFHLAAIVSVPYSMDYPEETMETNYRASVRLLQEADSLGFKSFVFAGSAAEYGDDQRMPLREEYATAETRHLSPYGRAKFLASREVGANQRGVALRFFNIYGPRQDPRSPYSGVISRFIDMAGEGRALTIFGDGLQTRDFVYVSDVVNAYIRAAGLEGGEAAPHGIYNIGVGRAVSILEIADVIREICGKGGDLNFLPERPGDIRHSLAAVDKFGKTAGWSAGVSLNEGLRKTVVK